MTNTWKLQIAVLVGGGLAAMGCTVGSEPTLPSVESLAQGVSILQSEPDYGVTGAYRAGDDVVYFQTRVGYLKPEFYRESFPDEPANEMDMRFLDRDGNTFYLQRGGDSFVDPTWGEDFDDAFQVHVPDAQRAHDFELAQQAGLEFPKSTPPELSAHAFEMRQVGERPTPAQDPKLSARAAEIEAARTAADSTWGGSGSWWLEGDMYTKSIAIFGSHAGVAMYAYDTGWHLVLVGYNHSDWSHMSYKCYSSSNAWIQNPSFDAETNTSIKNVTGGCSTPYNWNAYGGEHNSNDDASYELWQSKEGKTNTSHGDSRTFQWQANNKHYACGVSCGGNCGGRWTAPANCP